MMSASEKVAIFFKQCKPQVCKKGATIIRAQETPSGIFYIEKGRVKKYLISHKGDELIVNMFNQGSFFPMSWAINDTENEYYYETVDESILYKAPKKEVLDFLKKEPDVLYDLLARVFRGADGMTTRMTYLMAGSARTRLISELIIEARRFGKITSTGDIEIVTSETELAAQSGMTRETVSREMKSLK
ncbi:MAG: Crp/Fnr family transcriptional regulator, partial [Candidatus Levybacteria bacterium]|nr:Crp/Fnr family transcriptional regulator [Candidatus Levybacteria bacterium]